MDRRLELDAILRDVLGNNHTYFQPPASIDMEYPAIRYSRVAKPSQKADDAIYIDNTTYKLILIDRDPDSEYLSKLLNLPYTRYVNGYQKDGLNHDVIEIVY